jgi:hypothetical protein
MMRNGARVLTSSGSPSLGKAAIDFFDFGDGQVSAAGVAGRFVQSK